MSLVNTPVSMDESSELDAMYDSVGGPVAWEQLQAETVKKKKKGVIEAIAQALQSSSSPAGNMQASGGMGPAQGQLAQAQQDQQLGMNIGSLARNIGTRIFDTGGYAVWGDEDNDENDDDVIAKIAAMNRDLPESAFFDESNVQELEEGGTALVGGNGPEIMRREGNAVQVVPVARPHADALMDAIKRQAEYKDKKPGVKSRIAAALLGGAQGLLSSSATPAVRQAAAMTAPNVQGAIARLGDSGNSAARRRIAEEIQARTRAAQIEEGQVEYEARRQHEARMGQRAGESAAAAERRWEAQQREAERRHKEMIGRMDQRANTPDIRIADGTVLSIDRRTGEVKKLFEPPEKPAAPKFAQYVNEQGVYTTDLNNPGAPAVPRVGPDGKPLPGRKPRPLNSWTQANSQLTYDSKADSAKAKDLAGSVMTSVALKGKSGDPATIDQELNRQAEVLKVDPGVYFEARNMLRLPAPRQEDPRMQMLQKLVGGGQQTTAPAPSTQQPAPSLTIGTPRSRQ